MQSKHQVVELRFDSKTKELLNNARLEFVKQGIAEDLPEGDPHISLSSFSSGNLVQWEKALEQVASLDPFLVEFSYLGLFRAALPVLYLGVTPTSILSSTHEHVHEYAASMSNELNEFFIPNRIVYHCTLAYPKTEKNLAQALEFAMSLDLPKNGHITSAALIEYSPAKALVELELGRA